MMTVRILTFMNIEIGKTLEVVEVLRRIKEIIEINYITGEYDLAILMEGESSEKIHQIFTEQIEKIPYIIRSSSNLIIKRWIADAPKRKSIV